MYLASLQQQSLFRLLLWVGQLYSRGDEQAISPAANFTLVIELPAAVQLRSGWAVAQILLS